MTRLKPDSWFDLRYGQSRDLACVEHQGSVQFISKFLLNSSSHESKLPKLLTAKEKGPSQNKKKPVVQERALCGCDNTTPCEFLRIMGFFWTKSGLSAPEVNLSKIVQPWYRQRVFFDRGAIPCNCFGSGDQMSMRKRYRLQVARSRDRLVWEIGLTRSVSGRLRSGSGLMWSSSLEERSIRVLIQFRVSYIQLLLE